MINSMTAFGRSQGRGEWGSAIWELRSINHRYLDLSIKLPDTLRELEPLIREILHKYIQRGKIECFLKFQINESANLTSINLNLLKQLINRVLEIEALLPQKTAQINLTDLLSWKGVLNEEELDLNIVKKDLLKIFEQALQELTSARQREGKILEKMIIERIDQIQKQANLIKKVFPNILDRSRDKILQRLEEAQITLDPQRLEQEMVYFAQKIDVAEEIDRIFAHITEVRASIAKPEAIGRRLDFMMQELNREANTLASKSTESVITHAAVEMKVLIEQIREQVQNIE